jgi:hypothetical protein
MSRKRSYDVERHNIMAWKTKEVIEEYLSRFLLRLALVVTLLLYGGVVESLGHQIECNDCPSRCRFGQKEL